ncbi:hypothetical protein [Streptomyces sp. HF10]|uniref:hypothetical protein n=1 Tax=Streptomyces sp. HF10 TaxID=2692233 RepID=UPI001316D253|nr:hypothetical protein [Streptomyces sp. HF10]QHC33871.1 hypothetical protein GR129_34770 [Streptomyces sp. HF10]
MPLNVPVTITLPPIDRSYTVHTDRQRWSAEQLAAEPDGRAAQETAVREGVRKAASTCAYAQLTEPDIDTAAHPDGSVTMTGRVLCDEDDCHAAAQRHHFDAAESIEAKAAADWAAEKDMGVPAGELRVVQERVRTAPRRQRRRASLAFMAVGLLCVAIGVVMSRYDYTKPAGTSPGIDIDVWIWTNVDSLCNHLASPLTIAGALIAFYGVVRDVTTK